MKTFSCDQVFDLKPKKGGRIQQKPGMYPAPFIIRRMSGSLLSLTDDRASTMNMKISLIALVLITSLALPALAGSDQHEESAKVGSTLNKKVALDVGQIPASAMSEIKAIKPGFAVKEAEREFKHGNVYLDIEGEADGAEIEFDMLQTESGWKVVEVQRDLTWVSVPEDVAEALKADSPGFMPKRIIESVQYGTDITIYEFYAVDADGKESRTEVKVEKGVASVLDEEWTH